VTRLPIVLRAACIAVPLGLWLSANAATAPTARDLARCADIAAPDARLTCYDTLAGRSADHAASAATPAPRAASAATPAPRAASAATPAPRADATTTPTTSATPAAAAASTPVSDPRNFGLTPRQQKALPERPAAIQARIEKFTDTGTGHAYVVLDNGQTWTFADADADARLGPGDPVTIKRASLGSFLLVTQTKRSYHVRRTQ
jgi:hypothetical protein